MLPSQKTSPQVPTTRYTQDRDYLFPTSRPIAILLVTGRTYHICIQSFYIEFVESPSKPLRRVVFRKKVKILPLLTLRCRYGGIFFFGMIILSTRRRYLLTTDDNRLKEAINSGKIMFLIGANRLSKKSWRSKDSKTSILRKLRSEYSNEI